MHGALVVQVCDFITHLLTTCGCSNVDECARWACEYAAAQAQALEQFRESKIDQDARIEQLEEQLKSMSQVNGELKEQLEDSKLLEQKCQELAIERCV